MSTRWTLPGRWRRALGLAWRAGPALLVVQLALAALGALLPVAVAWSTKGLLDGVVARDAARALRWLGLELALTATTLVFARVGTVVRARLSRSLVAMLNERLLATTSGAPLATLESPAFQDDHDRASRDTFTRPLGVLTESVNLLQGALTFVAAAAVLARYGAWIVAVVLGVAAVSFALQRRFKVARVRLVNGQAPARRHMAHLEEVLTARRFAKELRAFGTATRFVGDHRSRLAALNQAEGALELSFALRAAALDLAGSVALYANYAVVAASAIAGGASVGDLTLYLMTFRVAHQSFFTIASAVAEIVEHQTYLQNVFHFFDRYATHRAFDRARTASPRRAVLELHRVAFRYGDEAPWTIDDASFALERGEVVAVVGANGSGKTTLLKLLLGLYAPTRGRVVCAGEAACAMSTERRAELYAVAFQDPAQYALTVRDALRLGGSAVEIDDDACLRALDRAGATSASLGGLDALLGPTFEGGVDLSGGQWQKVALARALAHPRALVLALDEPTRDLDAGSKERLLFELRAEARRGRCVVVVTHDDDVVRMADRVLELRDGQIAARDGSPAAMEAAW